MATFLPFVNLANNLSKTSDCDTLSNQAQPATKMTDPVLPTAAASQLQTVLPPLDSCNLAEPDSAIETMIVAHQHRN